MAPVLSLSALVGSNQLFSTIWFISEVSGKSQDVRDGTKKRCLTGSTREEKPEKMLFLIVTPPGEIIERGPERSL